MDKKLGENNSYRDERVTKNKRGFCTVKRIDDHKPRRTKHGSFNDTHNTMGEIALSSRDV
jgi:hypothetical protein